MRANGGLLRALLVAVLSLMVLSACTSSADEFPVMQEIIYFSAPNGVLSSRVERIPFTEGAAPDQEIRRHLGWSATPPPGSMVHSTSWRYDDAAGGLVLTWAVTPDPKAGIGSTPVTGQTVAQGADAAHPVPSGLGDEAVITHAARHLAFLMETDPEVDKALARDPALHAALRRFAPALAGTETGS